MAFLAAFLKNGGDLLCIGNLSGSARLCRPLDEATGYFRARRCNRFACKQSVEGVLELSLRRLVTAKVEAVLVIYSTAITNYTFCIEQDHLRRPLHAIAIRHPLVKVLE